MRSAAFAGNSQIDNVIEQAFEAKRIVGTVVLAAVESQPTFAMFVLDSGVKLGLWGRRGVEPAPTPPGGSELAFAVADADAVHVLYAAWQELAVEIVQTPVVLDFGFTFVGVAPDGHRLRVFASMEE